MATVGLCTTKLNLSRKEQAKTAELPQGAKMVIGLDAGQRNVNLIRHQGCKYGNVL